VAAIKPPPVFSNSGEPLGDDAVELGRAMAAYQHRHGRRFPTYSEVLLVARGLGYRRPDDA
jgi:hypothetical protein